MLGNISKHENNMIYMYTTKLQGLYQNNVNSRTISITVKWAYIRKTHMEL